MVEIEKEVAQSEVNGELKAKYASIITYMQDCSFVHLFGQEPLMKEFRERNMGLFLTSRQCTLFKIPVFKQKLIVRTWVYELNRFYGYRNTVVYDKNSMEVMAASFAGGTFVDLATGQPARVSDENVEKVLIEDKFDGIEYLPRKVRIPKDGGIEKEPTRICRSHLDSYMHTNNAQYIKIAMDCLDKEYYPKTLRAEYKTPTRAGDMVCPTVYDSGNGKICIVLRNGNGDVCLASEIGME